MSLLSQAKADPVETLFETLDKVRFGMFGPSSEKGHMQPMTHFADQDRSTVWFITSAKTDLARVMRADGDRRMHHCVIGPDQNYFACLMGRARQSRDEAKLDELWSPMVGAWFPGGRDDPDVMLIQLQLEEASVWATADSSLVFGFEMARSLLDKDHTPNVGEHEVLRFGAAAPQG